MNTAEKLGVVGIPVTPRGDILIFPGLAENTGKQERVIGHEDQLLSVLGYELLGGAVDPSDVVMGYSTTALALLRETGEERGLILSLKQLVLSSERYEVEQLRGDSLKKFLVACYVVNLTDLQEDWLRDSGAVNYGSAVTLRPRDKVIAREFVTNYLVPAVVGATI